MGEHQAGPGRDHPLASPFRVLFRDRPTRRVALGYGIFNGAESAAWVALMIYAYDHGGATESGVVALTQLLPAAAMAPIAGVFAERSRPERILALGYWAQSAALALAALTLALEGPAPLVYGFVTLMTVAVVTTRPAQALLTPRLARDPDELTAVNVVTEWTAQAALFLAPAVAGGLLAVAGVGAVFATFAAALAVGALAVPRLAGSRPAGSRGSGTGDIVPGAWSEVVDGIRVASGDPAVRLVLLLSAVGYMIVGAIDVMTVVLAIDRLGGTASEAAWMAAALGAGGVMGAAMSGVLIGRRLAPALAVAACEFGVALGAIGMARNVTAAYILLFAAGAGQAVLGIAGQSLLQRCAPTNSVGRIFALRESLYNIGLAAGSILAAALIAVIGTDRAFIVVGGLLPAVALARAAAIWRLDDAATVPIVALSLLRALPIFARLPGPALEGLARNATTLTFSPGEYLMREGDPGDRYLAIVEGEVEVIQNATTIVRAARGDGVGETALLRDVPRTASVRARTPVQTLALTKNDFLVAVTGHDATHQTAVAIAARLTGDGEADPGAPGVNPGA